MSEVTENLYDMTKQVITNYFGIKKVKITRTRLEEIVAGAYTAGVVTACDVVIRKYDEDKELTKDDIIGETHLLKVASWNEYAKINHNLKKVGIEEAMDPDINYSKIYKNVGLVKSFEKAMHSMFK